MSSVSILGACNTRFGTFAQKDPKTGRITDTRSIYELIVEAGRGALQDAGIGADEVSGVWLGACSPALFCDQEHLAPAAVEVDPEGLRFKPITRVEGACASSSVALYNAAYAIESGRFAVALVIGVEKMSLLDTAGVTHALACSSYWPEEGGKGMTFPGLFAEYAKGYQARYGLSDDLLRRMLATVAALCYRNGVENPLAHFGPGSPPDRRRLFDAEAILGLPEDKNPLIAAPLRLHDCSLISDGAAALVLASTERARAQKEAVIELAGIGHTEERLPISVRPNMYELAAAKSARELAFAEAGIRAQDMDLAEVHDCFTINQLLCTEALGLSADGRAGYDYLEGRFTREDRCPVNLSGGLKAKGHPVGATGASMHALLYKQLAGKPIGVPCPGAPEVGVALNVGGSAVTNCVTVLRRLR
jgi:acetyl-CoA C-acetyltransferase